jgi:glutaredoxin
MPSFFTIYLVKKQSVIKKTLKKKTTYIIKYMIYCCEKCKAEFLKKSNYDQHINRKTPCILEKKEQYDLNKRSCQYCPKILASVNGAKVHMLTCKYKPSDMEKLTQIIIEMNNEMKEMKKEIKEKINTPNITNITNNIQNNIIMIPFGKEDLSFLTLKDYKKIFNKGCYSIPEIIKLIHCNDDKPEYMNVYIKNFKDEYMFTFDGKDWDIEKKDVVLNNMIENKKNFLESKFDDMQNELPQYAINMFKKFLERSDDNEVINSIKDELKNMFYKNRNHVIKTIKSTKKLMPDNSDSCKSSITNNLGEKKPKKKINAIKN